MIVAYVGSVGSGKTLNMVWDCMNSMYHGRHVISNTPIEGIMDPIFMKQKKIKAEFIPNGDKFKHALAYRENCTFALDEAAVYLPNYFWNKLPEEFIVKFAQNRKYNTDILYTTQGFGMAVSRLRELTQIVYKCFPTRVLFRKCYVAKRFDPAFFRGEQTQKKYDRFFRGQRTLYPSQQKRIFKAYDTLYVVDSSATMKVSGFTQPKWQNIEPGHDTKRIYDSVEWKPVGTEADSNRKPEIPGSFTVDNVERLVQAQTE
jgi:zona occludens toxin (predicted ATPase)